MVTQEHYERLYSNPTQYYVAVRQDGIFFIEGPKTCRRRKTDHPEAVLCLFMNSYDANAYRDSFGEEVSIRKITLTGLWAMLKTIDSNAMMRFKAPVRVEVCTVTEGGHAVTIDVLHSNYVLLN